MKKGFTLIELLAVIVILAIIALIASPIVLSIINEVKESAILRSSDFYLSGVEKSIASLVLKNIQTPDGTYPIMEDGNICIGTVNNNECNGDILKVEIDGEKPTSGIISIINGQVSKISLNLSNKAIVKDSKGELVFEEKLEEEVICKLINKIDNNISITPGDKYQCKVKDDMEEGYENGYYFHVLSSNEDGTTNLIMERNIYYDKDNDVGVVATKSNLNVAWITEEDYTYAGGVDWSVKSSRNKFGPVTAMNYLYNATKDWDNIPDMIMDYDAEGNEGSYGYGGIKTEGNITKIINKNGEAVKVLTNKEGYTNLKSRLIFKEEIWEKLCTTEYGSCPLWLVNYMSSSDYYQHDGKINASATGFWLYSTPVTNQNVNFIKYDGRISSCSADTTIYGVRPVITLEI